MIQEETGHITSEGNEYLIEFEQLPDGKFLKGITIIEVTLKLILQKSANNTKDIADLGGYIIDFLVRHPEAIIYYYCDSTDLIRSERHKAISPQEFRNKLFNCLYYRLSYSTAVNEKYEDLGFWKESADFGREHFFSFIGRKESEQFKSEIRDHLEQPIDK